MSVVSLQRPVINLSWERAEEEKVEGEDVEGRREGEEEGGKGAAGGWEVI